MSTRVFVKACEGQEHMHNHQALAHPGEGHGVIPIQPEGSWWPYDHYTMIMIRDGLVEVDDSKEEQKFQGPGPSALMFTPQRGAIRNRGK